MDDPIKHQGKNGVYPGTAYSDYSSHGGEDVSIQGKIHLKNKLWKVWNHYKFTSLGIGPWAHLVTGNHEQTFVAGLTEFALCVGDYANEDHCDSVSTVFVSFSLLILAMAL